jgi:hypothetical protein
MTDDDTGYRGPEERAHEGPSFTPVYDTRRRTDAPAAAAAAIPPVTSTARPADFGHADGSEVSNQADVLAALDALCNADGRMPDVEIIFTEPWALLWLGVGVSTNPYGHLSVRYCVPSLRRSVVMNVVGFGGSGMVHFLSPEKYFFGTHDWTVG